MQVLIISTVRVCFSPWCHRGPHLTGVHMLLKDSFFVCQMSCVQAAVDFVFRRPDWTLTLGQSWNYIAGATNRPGPCIVEAQWSLQILWVSLQSSWSRRRRLATTCIHLHPIYILSASYRVLSQWLSQCDCCEVFFPSEKAAPWIPEKWRADVYWAQGLPTSRVYPGE